MGTTTASRRRFLAGAGAATAWSLSRPAFAQGKAEVGEIVLAPQFGLAYLPLHVMKSQKLVESHLARNGLPNTKVSWAQTTGGASANAKVKIRTFTLLYSLAYAF